MRLLVGEVHSVTAQDRLREPGDDPTLDVTLACAGGVRAELHACCAADWSVFEMDLIGSRGRVCLTDSGDIVEVSEVVDGIPFAGYRSLVPARRVENSLRDVLLHAVTDLASCLQSGAVPRCTGEDGVRALRIALAARASAARGQPVRPEEVDG